MASVHGRSRWCLVAQPEGTRGCQSRALSLVLRRPRDAMAPGCHGPGRHESHEAAKQEFENFENKYFENVDEDLAAKNAARWWDEEDAMSAMAISRAVPGWSAPMKAMKAMTAMKAMKEKKATKGAMKAMKAMSLKAMKAKKATSLRGAANALPKKAMKGLRAARS